MSGRNRYKKSMYYKKKKKKNNKKDKKPKFSASIKEFIEKIRTFIAYLKEHREYTKQLLFQIGVFSTLTLGGLGLIILDIIYVASISLIPFFGIFICFAIIYVFTVLLLMRNKAMMDKYVLKVDGDEEE